MTASLAATAGGEPHTRRVTPPPGASASALAGAPDPLLVWAREIVRERFPIVRPVAGCVRCRCDLYEQDIARGCGESGCPLGEATSDGARSIPGVVSPSGATADLTPRLTAAPLASVAPATADPDPEGDAPTPPSGPGATPQ